MLHAVYMGYHLYTVCGHAIYICSTADYAYGDPPQAIRTKLRELDNGWEELNNIYLHERNKRKSKLSTEEVYISN